MALRHAFTAAALLLASSSNAAAFTGASRSTFQQTPKSLCARQAESPNFDEPTLEPTDTNLNTNPTRRAFLATAATSSLLFTNTNTLPSHADDTVEVTSTSFESIAARAARVSQEIDEAEAAQKAADDAAQERKKELAQKLKEDKRTIYDFTLPVGGVEKKVGELVGQDFVDKGGLDGWTDEGVVSGDDGSRGEGTRVKAILVVNIKQDDPIARKNIPELIALVNKFGKNGEFAVIVSPTDQGYYEPDTSALIRLKMAAEYGYGSSPGTILTDKVNLLGSGAIPFWRWLEGSCRTPAGLGKIQANFEKFLVDGRTGKPLRRYPRKYQPYDIADDISAIIQGKPLPPAGANFKEEWRNAAKEAENDTYRFQKGLNYFDQ